MSVRIIQGDCRETLKALPDGSVNCCVTSPPYWGLRDYGHPGQIGQEKTPEEFVAALVGVFREVRRVLKDDGTLWLNLGDSYAAARSYQVHNTKGAREHTYDSGSEVPDGLKPKDLVGIPWRVAFALQADGWWLRQDIIWHKPNPMPESVTDRCTKAHEYIFLLSKSARYFYDAEAIAEDAATDDLRRPYGSPGANALDPRGRQGSGEIRSSWKGSAFHTGKTGEHQLGRASKNRGPRAAGNKSHKFVEAYELSDSEEHRTKAGLLACAATVYEKRNKRSVWTVTTKPYREAHFATFPPDLVRPAILAGCPRGGTVLDPFGGSGTTGEVAEQEGRHSILCELNPKYVELIEKRTAQGGLLHVA